MAGRSGSNTVRVGGVTKRGGRLAYAELVPGRSARRHLLISALLLIASACASTARVELAAGDQAIVDASPTPDAFRGAERIRTDDLASHTSTPTPTVGIEATETTSGLLAGGVDPATLTTTPEGNYAIQPTPEPLRDRRLPTLPRLTPPVDDGFAFTIGTLTGDPLHRSTWNEQCPVPTEDLRYVTVAFWGFDGLHHTGELIVAAEEADGIVAVFQRLHATRFPIEEMRIVTPADVVARRTGDGNNTASFVCRSVTGGSRFSEHAYGLAVDINPFHNPYQRDDLVIPTLSSSYLDRTQSLPGMIVPGDPASDEVIAAFASIGWSWGGNWSSLKDYQHFAKHNR